MMRLVSLCPSLTELVFDLDRGDELVGVTSYCVHPADRVGRVENVGGTKDPDVARIVELAPDLVLMNSEENRLEDAEALEAAGVRVHASFPRTVPDTAAMVRDIARALARPAQGEAIARDIEVRATRVAEESRSLAPVRWADLIWRKPYMSVNRDTFAHALLELAGGVNVFGAEDERYPQVTATELARARPDVVLLGSEPYPFEARHADELAQLTGLSRAQVLLVDGEYLSWHGSRTPDGIDYAAQCLRGAPPRASDWSSHR
jgi:ABC-type Fe3+-hydroxamate transport system substrate-binding protein